MDLFGVECVEIFCICMIFGIERCFEKIKCHVKLCIFLVKNQVLLEKNFLPNKEVIGLYRELRPEVHGLARKTEKSINQVPNQVQRSREISKSVTEPGNLIPGRFRPSG